MLKRTIMGLLCIMGLAACGTINSTIAEKHKTFEFYRIFNIETNADRDTVSDSASKGLTRWITGTDEIRPIPSYTKVPAKPGRFSFMKNQFTSGLGALAAMSGQILKVVQCKDAVWIDRGNKDIGPRGGINLTACIFKYKGGYSLDMYGTWTRNEGFTLDPLALAGKAVSAAFGSPAQWMEKVVADTTQQLKNDLHAKVTFVEGYPKPVGQPWWSQVKSAEKE